MREVRPRAGYNGRTQGCVAWLLSSPARFNRLAFSVPACEAVPDMEQVLVKTMDQEVSKAAVQEKQLLLSLLLVRLAHTLWLKRSSPSRTVAGHRVAGCCGAMEHVIPPATGHPADRGFSSGPRPSFLSP